ncbi:hypothetical protein PAI11_07670 [Patulibacter medicamentivorans]|jgi:hypothetical protein|uniref:Uncharacterized protein n=1 Tax=Patulibacter medicamentivorans TaxID=1097667 RepID=H0E1V5_9ACTN|nr:hypothetical protein [Patulibacter medicamentivorans]EHN12347.1 hypothetical protein PAI11_07670 [Patulibacter medicamentivorans]
MGLIYSVTFSVLVWMVLWALGFKVMDATMIAVGIILIATMVNRALSYLPGRGGPDANGS